MSAAEAAVVAVQLWPASAVVTAVAIAGSESDWTLSAVGDRPDQFDPAVRAELLPWTCPPNTPTAPTSIGPWQVNLSNYAILPYHTNCQNQSWLLASWANNAKAAHALWLRDGFGPWTSYVDGRYRAYLPQAQVAVTAALASAPSPPPASTMGTVLARRPSLLFVALGLLGLVGLGAVGDGEIHR